MNLTWLQSRSALLIVTTAGTTLLTRLFLLTIPEAGGSSMLGVHVHHLLIGILLVCLGGIPAVLLRSQGPLNSLAVAVFGVGLGLSLDEWVLFVIREAAPDAPYMTPAAVIGAAILVVLVIGYTVLVDRFVKRKERLARVGNNKTRQP